MKPLSNLKERSVIVMVEGKMPGVLHGKNVKVCKTCGSPLYAEVVRVEGDEAVETGDIIKIHPGSHPFEVK